jgi:transcriptional regulator with XRE-family HTH domain
MMLIEVHSLADLGKTVRMVRERHGWSQDDLSAAVGVTQRYLSELETAKRPKVLDDSLIRALSRLGITLIAEVSDE